MGEMSFDGGCDEGKNIAALLTTTLNHRQHRLDKSTAPYALSSKRQLPPNYRVTQRTLARVVRRLNTFMPQKRPQPSTMLVQLAGGASQAMPKVFRLAVAAVAGQHGWPNSASRNSAVRRLLWR